MKQLLTLILIVPFTFLSAQEVKNELGHVLRGVVIDSDTLPHSYVKPVVILPPMEFKSHAEYLRYRRLVRDVKKVYPYSVLARNIFGEVTHAIDTIENKRDERKFVKSKDKELQAQYTDELKKLTITQGRILIKLIDRETGSTSYDVVKELRGSVSAFMWQQMARLFGSNLKTGFDAEGDDQMIERIIVMIENGQI